MTPLPTAPLTPQDGTIPLPPDTDLGAMVKAILEELPFVIEEARTHDWSPAMISLATIHDTAQRLKVALEQEQAVMGEMAKALTGMQAVVAESAGIDGWHLNGALANWDEFDFVADAATALAQYQEARHVP